LHDNNSTLQPERRSRQKTASAVNLAYLAAADGMKTLVWDLDPQGSASFYLNAKSPKNASSSIFSDELSLKNAVKDSAF